MSNLARTTGTKVNTIRFAEQSGMLPQANGPRPVGGSTPSPIRNAWRALAKTGSWGFRHLAEIVQKIAELAALRTGLGRLLGFCSHGTLAICKIIETLVPRLPRVGET